VALEVIRQETILLFLVTEGFWRERSSYLNYTRLLRPRCSHSGIGRLLAVWIEIPYLGSFPFLRSMYEPVGSNLLPTTKAS
jgi:hypothetical protein